MIFFTAFKDRCLNFLLKIPLRNENLLSFSFTEKFLIGPGNVNNYLGEGGAITLQIESLLLSV